MSWFRKILDKTGTPVGGHHDKDADLVTKVIDSLRQTFGDYALHYGFFNSINEARVFLGNLSFMKISRDEVISPMNMQISVIKYDDGARLFIGGQLTEDQNLEVLKLARSCGVDFKSMAAAKETSLVYQEFIKAGFSMQEQVSKHLRE